MNQHPSPEQLRQFHAALALDAGDITGADYEEIKAHLDVCVSCNQFLEGLSTDSLVEILRERDPKNREPEPFPDGAAAAECSPPWPDLAPALRTVSDYELIRLHPQGGLSTVYTANDKELG